MLSVPFLSFTGDSHRWGAEGGRASLCLEIPGRTKVAALQKGPNLIWGFRGCLGPHFLSA